MNFSKRSRLVTARRKSNANNNMYLDSSDLLCEVSLFNVHVKLYDKNKIFYL